MQINAVKKHIHVVYAMSHMNESFKTNLLNFPSIINCNTIDLQFEWPENALISVAQVQIAASNLDLEEYKNEIIQMFSIIHKSVETMSKR